MTRAKTLGWFYETEQIKNRISQYQGVMTYVSFGVFRLLNL